MYKILVVDDDTDMLYLVELALTQNNFAVNTISKWQIVSESIKTFSPDLLLLDVNLGDADGGEICKTLKESKVTNGLPVILYSAHMTEEYCKACKAEGYLKKPFQIGELVNIIMHNLREKVAQRTYSTSE